MAGKFWQSWLADADDPETAGGDDSSSEQRFLLEDPGTVSGSGSSSTARNASTITKSELVARIAEVGARDSRLGWSPMVSTLPAP